MSGPTPHPHSCEPTAGGHPEILGLGVSTIDEFIVLQYHPRINEKQRVLSRSRQCGGLTGSALVAAARMGCRCGFLVALGTGDLSAFTREHMAREGVRLFEDADNPETEPYLSIILSEKDTGERSVLSDNSRSRPARIGETERRLALSSRCLFVDHVYAAAILPLALEAREAGIDVVGDFERAAPGAAELMDVTNHIILPLAFARAHHGDMSLGPAELAALLAAVPGRDVACVTDGANGAWYALGEKPDEVLHQPVFPVEKIVDTTGCGDVFHGVYAASLVQGFLPAERVRRAAAAAALKAGHRGAQAGAPRRDELEDFLHGH